jgi:hypothetical protein
VSELERRRAAQRARNARKGAAAAFDPPARAAGLSSARYRILIAEDPEWADYSFDLARRYPFYWTETERASDRVRSGRYTSPVDLATQVLEGVDALGISKAGSEPLLVSCESVDFAVELSATQFFSHCAALLGFFWERSGQAPNAMVRVLPKPRSWILMMDTGPGRHYDLVARPG